MLRLVVLATLLLAVFAWLTRSARARRAIWAILVLLAIYAVLKATGVIEEIAPSRAPVMGYINTSVADA